jgi:hypothetical protein
MHARRRDSMASGGPSSSATTSATSARLASDRKSGCCARARGKADRVARQRQRLDLEDRLAPQVQALAARYREMRLGCAIEPGADGGRAEGCDLLEVVEDDEAARAPGDRVAELHARVLARDGHLQRRRHRGVMPSCERASDRSAK